MSNRQGDSKQNHRVTLVCWRATDMGNSACRQQLLACVVSKSAHGVSHIINEYMWNRNEENAWKKKSQIWPLTKYVSRIQS